MQLELSKHQSDIVKALLEHQIKQVDAFLQLNQKLSPDERRATETGCKLMKELVRQIEKKER